MAVTEADRHAIRESLRRLLADRCQEADVRRAIASDAGWDKDLWARLIELGLPGVAVAEAFGGLGGGEIEIELAMEELGAALAPTPFFSSAVLAASLLQHAADQDAQRAYLPAIASGEIIATVALTGDAGTFDEGDVAVSAKRAGGDWTLDGVASFVTYGCEADILFVLARTPDGIGAFVVTTPSALERAPLKSIDPTQRLARVTFNKATATRLAGADRDTIERALDAARIALAGEQAGAARRIFDITVDYIKTRVQFGRAIGSFQAIKHMAADLMIEVESAASAARHAAAVLSNDGPDARAAVNLAAFACADAFSKVAFDAIQMHGGIAFTTAHPAHLYLRRARFDAAFLGAPNLYRERFISALENNA
ncbi:MAG: acyl-CoA dehydrogenase family protein [Hyphomonadaceae bacterium]